jgi:hypothetical protein
MWAPISEEHHNRISSVVSYEFAHAIKARSLQVARSCAVFDLFYFPVAVLVRPLS